MKTLTLALFAFVLFSCKKETAAVEHKIQLQCNVSASSSSYQLFVKGSPETDLTKEYSLLEGESIQLILTRDTVTTWLSATIYEDGKPVKYDEGYKDIQLDLTIPEE
jgi:hypothetical protein